MIEGFGDSDVILKVAALRVEHTSVTSATLFSYSYVRTVSLPHFVNFVVEGTPTVL